MKPQQSRWRAIACEAAALAKLAGSSALALLLFAICFICLCYLFGGCKNVTGAVGRGLNWIFN